MDLERVLYNRAVEQEWERVLLELARRINSWVDPKAGHVLVSESDIRIGLAEPILQVVLSDRCRLYLEATEEGVGQVPTVAFLYSYPTMRKVRLVGPDSDGSWEVQSSDGVPMKYAWSREGMSELIANLTRPYAATAV